MTDKETTVVTTGGSGASWFVIGILVVVVGIGAYLFLGGNAPGGGKDIDVSIELPKVGSPS